MRQPAARFIGEPCKKYGHTERYVSNRSCVACAEMQGSEWVAKNTARKRAACKRWNEENREKSREYTRNWAEGNREHVHAYSRAYHKANAERERGSARVYSIMYPERITERGRRWLERHPEVAKARTARRRALKRKAAIGCRKEYASFVRWVRTEPVIECHYCHIATDVGHRHMDHYIPLAKGGADAVENLRVSCVSCNQKKHVMMPDEFMKRFA